MYIYNESIHTCAEGEELNYACAFVAGFVISLVLVYEEPSHEKNHEYKLYQPLKKTIRNYNEKKSA